MLVGLTRGSWDQSTKATITNKKAALARAQGQRLGKLADIASLGDGEPLWLFSHGSDTSFAGLNAAELVGWLVRTVAMPAGARQLVLKGCRTQGYATQVQDVLNVQPGYEKVVVLGFEGEASQTTTTGEMLVRRGSTKEKEKAAQQGALAEIRARRNLDGSTLDKGEKEKRVKAEREKVERTSRTYTAVLDEGGSTFVAKDDRMARRLGRESAKESEWEEPEEPEEQPVLRAPARKKRKRIIDSDDDTPTTDPAPIPTTDPTTNPTTDQDTSTNQDV
jgi:hypothetical protein